MSTRNLLLCILWVLKNIDPTLLRHWWNTLSISRSVPGQGKAHATGLNVIGWTVALGGVVYVVGVDCMQPVTFV